MSRLEGRAVRALSAVLVAVACAPPLYLQFLPMVDLPQHAALARMVVNLNDPRFGFAPFYERAVIEAPAVLTPFVLGALANASTLWLATRLVVFASVALYPLGLYALLRVQQKPAALVLLGLPVVYASPFFWGFLPASLATGMAWLAIALVLAPPTRARRAALLALSCLLPLTHPIGVLMLCSFALVAALARRGEGPAVPWASVAPAFAGAVFWGERAARAVPVEAYSDPGLAFRVLQLPQTLLGGFVGPGETLLLFAMLVAWVYASRVGFAWTRAGLRALAYPERALSAFAALHALGYCVLPASTRTIGGLQMRSGVIALSLLPALVPRHALAQASRRLPALLLALGAAAALHAVHQLGRFDAEARPFAAILRHVPWRAKTVAMTYESIGHVARIYPYLQFPAYAQAERGGFLGLSIVDASWTVPVHRRADAPALPPLHGADWDPSLLQVQPHQFLFYDSVIVRGKEAREMTIFMGTPFRLKASAGDWLLYVR